MVHDLGYLPSVFFHGVAHGNPDDADGVAFPTRIDPGTHGRLDLLNLVAGVIVEFADGDGAILVSVDLPGSDAPDQKAGIHGEFLVVLLEGVLVQTMVNWR
uniref:Uncharacterized protein n=1 Tax=Candidatus Kentrum sp. FW TaxID=2126338 RepID=A0A450SFB4_9GAMM|nr:MAG: hypothetical protein BECKFW1821B_GA0114236_100934 [Candidatus Kentron sp. FW]